MLSNPGITIYRTLNRARAFWGFDYMMSRRLQMYYEWDMVSLLAVVVFEAGGYALAMVLALVGFFCARDLWSRAPGLLLLLVAFAVQVPYTLAFATGTYHFAAVALFFPFAGAALAGRPNISQLVSSRWLLVSLAIFALIQLEYAYHTLLHRPT